ncbi:TetR/AcrR family transcriptional regulator [Rhodococcus spelaei]|uniref:TetR/AcrR family transcriptional regulator n=1 Tax=Rhodococcus spelaei TaxID=2546320 RepID=A0A541B228_9NOCA|nr:TetR/AcrR family transcriptional regulator [Rhodococcus spelaei]TQF66374.1 TetR/AcrR family transcriptional regulator [Rhodococcus spelaei]
MSSPSTRDAVIAAARDLFARRGYTATTIKDIAAAAGCSPALVMKLMGSKAGLLAAADPSEPTITDELGAREPVGHGLVRRLVERRDTDAPEPLATVLLLIHESEDREAARADYHQRYVAAIADRIGDTSASKVRSQLVLAVLLGLAGGTRTMGLLGTDVIEREELIERYGALVQAIVDGADGP